MGAMMRYWILAGLAVLGAGAITTTGAQGYGASATLDSADILIGDQVRLRLELTVPAGSKVTWPALYDTLAAHIEVLRRSPVDTAASGQDRFTLQQELLITSFDSGNYIIPPIPFRFSQKGDTTSYYAETRPLQFSVGTVETDPAADIKPIKPPLKAPITFREIAPWLAGALILALIAGAVFYFIKRSKEQKPIFQVRAKPQIPPYELAMEAFEGLRRKKLWQSGLVKDYYTELTDIVREYIEGRFNIRALEMTTDEIHDALKGAPVEVSTREKLNAVLLSADLVKFAKAQPLPTENDRNLDECVDFVRATRPVADLRQSAPPDENPEEEAS